MLKKWYTGVCAYIIGPISFYLVSSKPGNLWELGSDKSKLKSSFNHDCKQFTALLWFDNRYQEIESHLNYLLNWLISREANLKNHMI